MKKFFNIFAALLALSVLSFGFIACSDDDDDDDGPSVSAAYVTEFTYPDGDTTYNCTYTLNFYDNKTYKGIMKVKEANYSYVDGKGTYRIVSGDWNTGIIAITRTHKANDDDKLVAAPQDEASFAVTNGSFTDSDTGFTYTKK